MFRHGNLQKKEQAEPPAYQKILDGMNPDFCQQFEQPEGNKRHYYKQDSVLGASLRHRVMIERIEELDAELTGENGFVGTGPDLPLLRVVSPQVRDLPVCPETVFVNISSGGEPVALETGTGPVGRDLHLCLLAERYKGYFLASVQLQVAGEFEAFPG